MKLGKIELLKKQKMGETQIIDYYNGTEQQKEENEKLKEEIEKIKKMNESLKKILKKKHPLPPSDLPEKLNKIIEELKEENEELKELKELRHLHKMRDYADDDGVPCIMNESGRDLFERTKAENRKLLVKNLKLNKDNRDLSLAIMAYENTEQDDIQTIEECKEENKELKEENEKLKKEIKKLEEKADSENTITMINKLNEECGRVVEENEKFKKEIESLKEEIKELKENYDEVKEYASHSQWGEHPLEDHDHLLSRISYLTDEETEYSVLQENYERIIAILERTECSPVFHQDIDETDVPDIIQKILELIDKVGIGFKMTKTEGD